MLNYFTASVVMSFVIANVKVVWGATHVTKPLFDMSVEADLKKYFEKHHTIQLDNFKMSNDEIVDDGRGKIITHIKN